MDTSASQEVTFGTVFPGNSATVVALQFESNRSWQSGTNMHEYTVAVMEGIDGLA